MPSVDRSDIAEFIRKYATPYDPTTDTYRRPPFAQSVKAGKNSPIYNAHSYHTKVPPEGIVPYIEHYTSPGDLVLDPFCGSGMTGVAALMAGRHAVLNDLSPAAVHIARNYTTPVDVGALKREFERIKAAVKEEFDWLYGTRCERCGGPATIQYTIWSDVFACARCGGDIVLWEVAVDPTTGKVAEKFACPTCQAQWKKTNLRWLRSVPVMTNYECPVCKPKRGEHPTTEAEKQRIAEIEAAEIPYWYPTIPFDESWEMWRGVHRDQNITDVSKFYKSRSLWAFARLWQEAQMVENVRASHKLVFLLTSFALRVSKKAEFRFSGGSGNIANLYIPAIQKEANVLDTATRKYADVLKSAMNETKSEVVVRTGTAIGLHDIADTL